MTWFTSFHKFFVKRIMDNQTNLWFLFRWTRQFLRLFLLNRKIIFTRQNSILIDFSKGHFSVKLNQQKYIRKNHLELFYVMQHR